MVIRESYLAKIRPFIDRDIIKMLTGIRRGGKSVLLEQIRDEIDSPNTIFQNVEIILENIVGLELLRRGYKVCIGRAGTKEIDFVGEKQGDKLYIQVCYLLSDEATIQREFGALLEVRDNYPKIVLYHKGSFRGNYEGIPAIRIEDWLTEEGSKHGQ